jgi:transcriptional regulator with XRE-family HTH domain
MLPFLRSKKGEYMDLATWLFQERWSVTDFARQLGISRSYLTLILSGTRRGSPRLALEIEQKTGGKVTKDEILYRDRTKKKTKK